MREGGGMPMTAQEEEEEEEEEYDDDRRVMDALSGATACVGCRESRAGARTRGGVVRRLGGDAPVV